LLLEHRARRIEKSHELDELRWAERVNVNLRKSLLDRAQEIDVPIQRQVRVHPTLHQNLRATDVGELLDFLQQHVAIQRVGVILIAIAAEGTERASGGADVGVVDVAVDHICANRIAVHVPAAGVGPSPELLDGHALK
jgi:hypothetical protein